MRRRLNLVKPAADWQSSIDAKVEAQCAALTATCEAPPGESLTAEQKEARWFEEMAPQARKELRAALRKMDDVSALQAWAAWKAVDPHHQGCTSPAESFIYDLLMDYARSICLNERGVTPDHVAKELETFRQDFDDMVSTARTFASRYREEISSPDKSRGSI